MTNHEIKALQTDILKFILAFVKDFHSQTFLQKPLLSIYQNTGGQNEVVPTQNMKAFGSVFLDPLIFKLDTRWRLVTKFTFRGFACGSHWIEHQVVARIDIDCLEERKVSYPCLGSHNRFQWNRVKTISFKYCNQNFLLVVKIGNNIFWVYFLFQKPLRADILCVLKFYDLEIQDQFFFLPKKKRNIKISHGRGRNIYILKMTRKIFFICFINYKLTTR